MESVTEVSGLILPWSELITICKYLIITQPVSHCSLVAFFEFLCVLCVMMCACSWHKHLVRSINHTERNSKGLQVCWMKKSNDPCLALSFLLILILQQRFAGGCVYRIKSRDAERGYLSRILITKIISQFLLLFGLF